MTVQGLLIRCKTLKKEGFKMKIALFGKMRSGKDTVGEMLINDYGFRRFAFATGIGQIIEEYFPEAMAEGKPRHHYQFIGQQLRQLNPDVWINYLLREVKDYEMSANDGKNPLVVVTDGRQSNEAIKMKEEGFTIVKVEAPDELRIKRIEEAGDVFTPELFEHETELEVDKIEPDYIITNDSDLKNLEDAVQMLLVCMIAEEWNVPPMVAYSIIHSVEDWGDDID